MISGFTRIDTVTVPDKFMSIIDVSDIGDYDVEEIKSILEKDKDSLDYLGVRSDTDPLDIPEVYKDIKSVKPRGMKVILISDGHRPDVLDDLVGAGYVHAMDILVEKEVTREQTECTSILTDNRCKYAVTVNAADHDEESVSAIADMCEGCSMFILRIDRNKPIGKSELSKMTAAAKKCTWNVRIS